MSLKTKYTVSFIMMTLIFSIVHWQYDNFLSGKNSGKILHVLALENSLTSEDIEKLIKLDAPNFKIHFAQSPEALLSTFFANPKDFDIVMVYSFQTNPGILKSLFTEPTDIKIKNKLLDEISRDFIITNIDKSGDRLFPILWSSNKYFKIEKKLKKNINSNDDRVDEEHLVLKGKFYFPKIMPLYVLQLDVLELIAKEGFQRENLESVMETLNSLLNKSVFYEKPEDLLSISENEDAVLFLDNYSQSVLQNQLNTFKAQTSELTLLWTLNWAVSSQSKNRHDAFLWLNTYFQSELPISLAKNLKNSSTLNRSNITADLDPQFRANYIREVELNRVTLPTDVLKGDPALSEDIYRHINLYLKNNKTAN